ncbi:MAG: hypothetical protein AABZ80_11905 [Gemmatimonadota bacterium]
MQAELFVLRIIHIVGGVFWVGAVTFQAFFLFPAVAEAGPAGGQVMQGLVKRKLLTWLPVTAVVMMLAGLRLLQRAASGIPGYYSTPAGMTYSITGALAILMFIHGVTVARPAAIRMAEVSKAMGAPEADKAALGAEMKKLQIKVAFNLKITAAMLLVAAVGMAIARYL